GMTGNTTSLVVSLTKRSDNRHRLSYARERLKEGAGGFMLMSDVRREVVSQHSEQCEPTDAIGSQDPNTARTFHCSRRLRIRYIDCLSPSGPLFHESLLNNGIEKQPDGKFCYCLSA